MENERDKNERERGKYTHDEKNKEIIYSTKVRVHFLPTEQNQPFIQIEREATGKSHKEATGRAEPKVNEAI